MNQDIKLTSVKLSCCDRDCSDRSAGCHGKCEKYKAYRAECDRVMEERYQKKQFEREVDTAVSKAVKRLPGKRSY